MTEGMMVRCAALRSSSAYRLPGARVRFPGLSTADERSVRLHTDRDGAGREYRLRPRPGQPRARDTVADPG
jgi:hypothetical protein